MGWAGTRRAQAFGVVTAVELSEDGTQAVVQFLNRATAETVRRKTDTAFSVREKPPTLTRDAYGRPRALRLFLQAKQRGLLIGSTTVTAEWETPSSSSSSASASSAAAGHTDDAAEMEQHGDASDERVAANDDAAEIEHHAEASDEHAAANDGVPEGHADLEDLAAMNTDADTAVAGDALTDDAVHIGA